MSDIFTAITPDGSLSLFSSEHRELYHNRVGAYTEALNHYSDVALAVIEVINNGQLPANLQVLDSCFGLGYNSFVLAQQLPEQISMHVTAVELDDRVLQFVPKVINQTLFAPLRKSGIDSRLAGELGIFKKTEIRRADGEDRKTNLTFDLIQSCLRDFLRRPDFDAVVNQNDKFDLIFHDPFSPKKMPELWTVDLFERYKNRLKNGGIILTYSSAPAVRGALLDLGFHVYRTPALVGKWGGTLAVNGNHLEVPLDAGLFEELIRRLNEEELTRLSKSSRLPYRDPGLSAAREDIVNRKAIEQEAFLRAQMNVRQRKIR